MVTSGNLLRRYVHGADMKADDPIAWYEGATFTTANLRVMRPDWQGSIVLVTDGTGGTVQAVNRYDEYGIPQTSNAGRFQYTGQAWIAELGMYYYKARIYSPTLGRFLQTDPIGYKDQVNLYAYVANDPVNMSDPTGMYECSGSKDFCNKVEAAVKQIRAASREGPPTGSRIPTRGQILLSQTAQTLGTKNDNNGVSIRSGPLDPGNAGVTRGSVITIDQAQTERGTTFIGEKWARFGEVISHEGAHVWFNSSKSGIEGSLEDERAAYRTQFFMNRYLQNENPLYRPYRGANGASEGDYVRDGAIDSCSAGRSFAQCFDASVGMRW